MTEGLLPCKTCGGQGVMTIAKRDFYVQCKICGYGYKSENPIAVVHLWNSRQAHTDGE